MIFKPYPKYTSCAIQWFNEIPQSWKQVRVEQYLIKKDENIGDLWSSTQLLSLTQKGIIEKDINDGKGKTSVHDNFFKSMKYLTFYHLA